MVQRSDVSFMPDSVDLQYFPLFVFGFLEANGFDIVCQQQQLLALSSLMAV